MQPRALRVIIPAALVLITFAVYARVGTYDFIHLDDDICVFENPHIQKGLTLQSFRWAFTTEHHSYRIPLTWLSYMLDYRLYRLAPGGYHLTNLWLHLINILLLFALLLRMTGALWRSAFAAALFALHPLHVESVAWITERKDVLSTFFWMLALLAYTRYAKRPGPASYCAAALLFACGLMAKPMVVTLPLVMLVLDWWPLRRTRPESSCRPARLVLEKIPFFVMSLLAGFLTLLAQSRGGALKPIEPLFRIANALVSCVNYVGLMLVPRDLSVLVLHPGAGLPLWKAAAAAGLLAAFTALAVRLRARRPYLAAGWLWYLISLVPVLGLVQAGYQARADRFTYLPLIGIYILTAWAGPDLMPAGRRRTAVLTLLAAGVLAALTACTWFQVRHWQNSITLFSRALEIDQNNYIIRNNLGHVLQRQNKLDEARLQFERALQINPRYAKAGLNLGSVLAAMGRLDEARAQFSALLRFDPGAAGAHVGLGKILATQGDLEGAALHFRAALQSEPGNREARRYLERAQSLRRKILNENQPGPKPGGGGPGKGSQ